ncbi:MAG: hypothetical protein GWP91_03065 [Rhodobacterales bacterium]|nr:hypothetical protein [Rhodobacterales bacterium]
MAKLFPFLLLFLLACGTAPSEKPTTTTDTSDSAVATTTTSTTPSTSKTNVTGESGQLAYWRRGNKHIIQLFAAEHLDGLPFAAPCAMSGKLCIDALPTTPDVGVPWTETSYDPTETSVTWLGNDILLDPRVVLFTVSPATGYGGYQLIMNGPPPAPLTLETAGEWGSFTAEAAVAQSDPLILTDPIDGYKQMEDELSFAWEPGAGALYLEVRLESKAIHELWLLTDDGEHTIPSSYFGDLELGDVIVMTLYRVVDQPSLDVNGNTLSVYGVSESTFVAGYELPPWQDDFESGNLGANWSTSGHANWSVAGGVVYEGTYAARSGNISDNQDSFMSISLNYVIDGTLSFYSKTDTESNYDFLRFKIDGVEQNSWSGNVNWAQHSYNISAGQHTFQWAFTKDGSVSTGADTVYVDLVDSFGGLTIP